MLISISDNTAADPLLHLVGREAAEQYAGANQPLLSTNTYAPLAAYWQDAESSASSAVECAFAKQVNDMQKYLLAHNDVALVWRNSELLRAKGQHSVQASDCPAQAPLCLVAGRSYANGVVNLWYEKG